MTKSFSQTPQKVEKSCATFLLCDPGWYVHKPDVQNKWDDNTRTHTHLWLLGKIPCHTDHIYDFEENIGGRQAMNNTTSYGFRKHSI